MSKDKKVRMVIEVDRAVNIFMRRLALESGLSMKAYILRAILEKNEREKGRDEQREFDKK